MCTTKVRKDFGGMYFPPPTLKNTQAHLAFILVSRTPKCPPSPQDFMPLDSVTMVSLPWLRVICVTQPGRLSGRLDLIGELSPAGGRRESQRDSEQRVQGIFSV